MGNCKNKIEAEMIYPSEEINKRNFIFLHKIGRGGFGEVFLLFLYS